MASGARVAVSATRRLGLDLPRLVGRCSWLGWAVLGLAAAAGMVRLAGALVEGMSSGHDFVQDYAAIHAIVSGKNPYEPYNDVTQALFGGPPHRGKLYNFHAPSSLIFFLPLLPLPYGGAFVAWGLLSLACLWAVCAVVLKMLGVAKPAVIGGLGALGLVALPPIRENFLEGQLNAVVAAGMVGMWAAQRSGRSTLAGMCLGAAFALKPIPGLFYLYYLWRREWRLLVTASLVFGLFNLIGLGLAGLDGFWLYATVNYPDHASYWPGYPDNASLRGLFTRLFGPDTWQRPAFPLPGAALALWIASSVALAGLAWLAARRADRTLEQADLEFAALGVLSLLATPIVWPHYYVVLVPALLILVSRLWRGAWRGRRWGWLGLAILTVQIGLLSTAHYEEPYREVGTQQLVALLLTYGVAVAVLRPHPQPPLPKRGRGG